MRAEMLLPSALPKTGSSRSADDILRIEDRDTVWS